MGVSKFRSPAKCGIVVKTLIDGAVAVQLIDPLTMRIVARGVLTAEERRTMGKAFVDDELWNGAAGETPV